MLEHTEGFLLSSHLSAKCSCCVQINSFLHLWFTVIQIPQAQRWGMRKDFFEGFIESVSASCASFHHKLDLRILKLTVHSSHLRWVFSPWAPVSFALVIAAAWPECWPEVSQKIRAVNKQRLPEVKQRGWMVFEATLDPNFDFCISNVLIVSWNKNTWTVLISYLQKPSGHPFSYFLSCVYDWWNIKFCQDNGFKFLNFVTIYFHVWKQVNFFISGEILFFLCKFFFFTQFHLWKKE